MQELINGRTVEEIKHDIEWSAFTCEDTGCDECKFANDCRDMKPEYGIARNALALIERLEAQVPRWISVEERQPSAFVSVMVHMTDAGDFPAVREGYRVSDNVYFVPALAETHPVDYWMEMPEMEGAK